MILKRMLILGALFLVSGCSLPPAMIYLNYFKTAADIGSYAVTKKSTTDHAISAVTKKDCNLLRIFLNEEICKEYENKHDSRIVIAKQEVFEKETVQEMEISNPNVTVDYSVLDGLQRRDFGMTSTIVIGYKYTYEQYYETQRMDKPF